MSKPVVLVVTDEDGVVSADVLRGDVVIVEVDFEAIGDYGPDAQDKLEEINALDLGLPTALAGVKTKLSDIIREDPPEDDEDFDDEDEEDFDLGDEDMNDEFDDEDDDGLDDEDEDEDDDDLNDDDDDITAEQAELQDDARSMTMGDLHA